MSSGQQSQNPLLLLGQYSDDEVDEGSSKGPNDTKVHNHEEVLIIPPISFLNLKLVVFIPDMHLTIVFVLCLVVMLKVMPLILIISLINSGKQQILILVGT